MVDSKKIADSVVKPFVKVLKVLWIVQLLLLVLRVMCFLDWSYAVVFIPLYLFLGITVLCVVIGAVIGTVQVTKEALKEKKNA